MNRSYLNLILWFFVFTLKYLDKLIGRNVSLKASTSLKLSYLTKRVSVRRDKTEADDYNEVLCVLIRGCRRPPYKSYGEINHSIT